MAKQYCGGTYIKGKEYSKEELKSLVPGTVIWIYYAKDNNPKYVRFDHPHMLMKFLENNEFLSVDTHGYFETWNITGDTSRGIAHYFEAKLVDK